MGIFVCAGYRLVFKADKGAHPKGIFSKVHTRCMSPCFNAADNDGWSNVKLFIASSLVLVFTRQTDCRFCLHEM